MSVIKNHNRVIRLIGQKGGCARCGCSFGEHGICGKDTFHPSCPRRMGKELRFTRYCFQSLKEKHKNIQVKY